jgi:hypothetical protein
MSKPLIKMHYVAYRSCVTYLIYRDRRETAARLWSECFRDHATRATTTLAPFKRAMRVIESLSSAEYSKKTRD